MRLNGRGARLVDLVKRHLIVMPVGTIGPLIARGGIAIDGRVGRIDDVIEGEVDVEVTDPLIDRFAPRDLGIAIVENTDERIVVDKPHGMHVHPIGEFRTGTLLDAVLYIAGARDDRPWGEWRPHLVHRLDRAASGLVVFTKAPQRGTFGRRYRATVVGRIDRDAGTIDAPLGRDPANDYRRAVVPDGQRAVTHYTVVARDAETTTVELVIDTGRTHQIRAHLASIGHPIVGDLLYTDAAVPTERIELRAFELL